jgi:tRNA nucleotidyltransferase (CCA-adding enzyme)
MYETLAWYNLLYFEEQVDTGVLYLMTLLFNLGDASRQEALERLGAPPRTHDIIMKSIPASAGILKRLPLRDPVGIYHLLKEVNLEILLFSMAGAADAKKKKEISLFLVELRKVRPLLKGRDLKKLGISEGPLYSKILSDLRDERLRGTLRTEEDEKRYVLDRYLAGARNARPK